MTIGRQEFEETGRLWLRGTLTHAGLQALDRICPKEETSKRLSLAPELACVLGVDGPVAQALEPEFGAYFLTRALLFNKSSDANWGVSWHQDRVIAVAEKHAVHGYGNWTRKDDTWHCEPPLSVLQDMLFLRLHLDDDIEGNGAMQIALGSHKHGRLTKAYAKELVQTHEIETCKAQRGDILVLNMLTLHCSLPSKSPQPRRVIRCDYASRELPTPLAWPA